MGIKGSSGDRGIGGQSGANGDPGPRGDPGLSGQAGYLGGAVSLAHHIRGVATTSILVPFDPQNQAYNYITPPIFLKQIS